VQFDLNTLPRRTKAAMILATDLALLPVALWAAFGFRLGLLDPTGVFGIINPFASVGVADIAIVVALCAPVLVAFKLHRIKLHAIDMDAISRVATLAIAIMVVTSVAAFLLQASFPRSVPFYFGAIFFILAILVRLVALRVLLGLASFGSDRLPVAIYGAGSAGIQLAASLKQSRETVPVMFVDDNPALHGLIVSGVRVKPVSILEKAAREGRIKQVLIAIPSLSVPRRAALVERLSRLGCLVKSVPSYVELVSGTTTVSDLRAVTTEELLARDRVELDTPEIAQAYAGRSIMVTGAGGSIGAELCTQILKCNPARLVLFERSEPALYEIDRLIRTHPDVKTMIVDAYLGSVTDAAAVRSAIKRFNVDVILHAAAYKHVPIIEHNEVEGARNNVLGTKTVVDAAMDADIERFILVSTDKAVRPSNVMGATKRMAELIVQDAQNHGRETGRNIRFSLVRFGNVLGSSGSVVPLFSKQIAAGGPVTVTHVDVTRFFMTIPEASRLVLLAGAYAEGNDLFVLDMGEPVKIMSLAERMIELSGRSVKSDANPDGDIAIAVTGLRPGEKLFEELLLDDDTLVKTPHEKILRASTSGQSSNDVLMMVERITSAVQQRDGAQVRTIAKDYVDGFQDSSKLIPFPKPVHEQRDTA
jgi:FlaA1/EpsC-like NDP-sugar epimerase